MGTCTKVNTTGWKRGAAQIPASNPAHPLPLQEAKFAPRGTALPGEVVDLCSPASSKHSTPSPSSSGDDDCCSSKQAKAEQGTSNRQVAEAPGLRHSLSNASDASAFINPNEEGEPNIPALLDRQGQATELQTLRKREAALCIRELMEYKRAKRLKAMGTFLSPQCHVNLRGACKKPITIGNTAPGGGNATPFFQPITVPTIVKQGKLWPQITASGTNAVIFDDERPGHSYVADILSGLSEVQLIIDASALAALEKVSVEVTEPSGPVDKKRSWL